MLEDFGSSVPKEFLGREVPGDDVTHIVDREGCFAGRAYDLVGIHRSWTRGYPLLTTLLTNALA
jgi:hypothetical protein